MKWGEVLGAQGRPFRSFSVGYFLVAVVLGKLRRKMHHCMSRTMSWFDLAFQRQCRKSASPTTQQFVELAANALFIRVPCPDAIVHGTTCVTMHPRVCQNHESAAMGAERH